MKFRGEENELIWESFTSKKILNESEDAVNFLVDIFEKYANDDDPYPMIGNVLRKEGFSGDDSKVINYAVNIAREQMGIDLDADAIMEQIGVGVDSGWEHEDLYGEDEEDDFSDDGDMDMDDDLGMEPESEGMVMEIDPVAPVEAHEVNEVLVSDLKKLAEYAQRLYGMKDSADFEDWMVQAITVASTYVSDVWHRLDAKADFANTGFEQADDFQQF